MVAQLVFTTTLTFLIGVSNCKHIFVINSFPKAANDELVSVVVLYRHGDRSPTASFPNDPYYNSSFWPEGYGQLLKKGVLNQYNLGKWLRNRYSDFLPSEYSQQDILVYSTDVDRTLMSAQANLAGLYPPVESHIWDDDLLWEPIPVHRMATVDPILTMNGACPRHDQLERELESSEFFENITQECSDLFKALSNYTGANVQSIGDVASIYDVLYVYRNHNESFLPSWVDKIDLQKVEILAGLQLGKAAYTDELKRLRAGPFYNYLISHFNDTVYNVSDVTKFLMLSGHDSTLSSVLSGMGNYDFHPPEFASTVIWELKKNSKEEYYVDVFYKRNITDALDQLKVANCSFDCTFANFQSNLSSVSIDSTTWQKECQSSSIKIMFSWSILLFVLVLQRFV